MTGSDCERMRELAAEVALGIADGEDRARALEHAAACPECRARLERLSALADELLLLAPAAEPPAGFESRVTSGIGAPRGRTGMLRRVALPLAAALAGAAIAAIGVWAALSEDRSLADSYRATLAVANGEYFEAAPMHAPGGEQIGYVYGYQGRSSWALAVIYDGLPDGDYRIQLITANGRRLPLRALRVTDGRGSQGAVTPVDYDRLTELRLLDPRGHEVADSELHD